jgi:DNA-binding LytR/AlgR family response regulator
MQAAHKDYLPIISRDLSQKVRIHSILYIWQETRYIHIVTDREEIVVRGKLHDLARGLPASFDFCHSYLIIDKDRVEKLQDVRIYFDNGTSIHVGKGSYVAFRKRFNEYLKMLS